MNLVMNFAFKNLYALIVFINARQNHLRFLSDKHCMGIEIYFPHCFPSI